jgi:hypothetical protein
VWTPPVVILVLGALVAFAPVAQFALRHPELFWDRAKRISVFGDPNVQARPIASLLESTARHLLMFNYRGDPNGRHNLPGAPMLDRFSAALLVLGLAICIVRWKSPHSVLLTLWLLVPLSGGILSTWFEAPQSLRSIGSLPAAYAIACLPLEWLANEWQRVFGQPDHQAKSRQLLTVAAFCLLTAVAVENATVYFYVWARDFASWAAFNPAETYMAQDIAIYRDRYDLLFDPLLTAHLTTRYLAPDYEVYHHFDPGTLYPLISTDKEGVLVFVAPDTTTVREQANVLYPDVAVSALRHPYSDNAVMYKLLFDKRTIESRRGLDVRYAPLQDLSGDAITRLDPQIDHNWSAELPAPFVFPFQASWTGGLLAPTYGRYTLHVEAPGEATLLLDGKEVMSGPAPLTRDIILAQGVHDLYLRCTVLSSGSVRLAWQPAGDAELRAVPLTSFYQGMQPTSGLVGRFYPNADWSGDPSLARIDRQIAYYFHFLPLDRPYSVRWTGRLVAPVPGMYQLGIKAISSASLSLDDSVVITPTDPGTLQTAEVPLTAGLHEIQVLFLDNQSHSQVYLYWQIPGQEGLNHIPYSMLLLPLEGAWWPSP